MLLCRLYTWSPIIIDSIAKIVTVDLIFDFTWSHVIEKCSKLDRLELGVCPVVKFWKLIVFLDYY